MLVWRFPNILIIHLKRFDNNGNKINNNVDFPINNLDLRKYCCGYDKKKSVFSLYGVCNHIGSINSGHYYSYCKHNEDWYNYDDDNISIISESKIVSKNAYCLFYKKK